MNAGGRSRFPFRRSRTILEPLHLVPSSDKWRYPLAAGIVMQEASIPLHECILLSLCSRCRFTDLRALFPLMLLYSRP